MDKGERRGEIGRKTTSMGWKPYALNWSKRSIQGKLAVCSFERNLPNKLAVLGRDERGGDVLKKVTEISLQYPATKVMWTPERSEVGPDLLATTSDMLRVWECTEDGLSLKCGLTKNSNPDRFAPLTSFDWNETYTNLIGTASVDTTCTIWDVEVGQIKTQLIAHDKEVFDMVWAHRPDVFATTGADGSVRMFDMRHLEHSTIIFETNTADNPIAKPLLRLSWNKIDPNYVATFALDSNVIQVLDIRIPSRAVAVLRGHLEAVNSIAWGPVSSSNLCSGGDDGRVLVFDLSTSKKGKFHEPVLSYAGETPVEKICWSERAWEWITAVSEESVHLLRL